MICDIVFSSLLVDWDYDEKHKRYNMINHMIIVIIIGVLENKTFYVKGIHFNIQKFSRQLNQ